MQHIRRSLRSGAPLLALPRRAWFSRLKDRIHDNFCYAIAAFQSALLISDEGCILILAQPSMPLTAIVTAGATAAGSHGLKVISLIEERSIGMDFERTLSVALSKMILYSCSSINGLRFMNGHDLSSGFFFLTSPTQRYSMG